MGNFTPDFRKGLKKARKRAGYKTQDHLAAACSKSKDTIQNWEQGKNKPSLDDFLDLCNLLDCDADYLLNNLDERTHDIDFICKYTGLSSKAVELLHDLSNGPSSTEEKRTISFINRVLSNPISPGRAMVETTLFSWLEQYVISASVKAWDMLNIKEVPKLGIRQSSGLTEEILPGDLYSEFLMQRIRDILNEYRKLEEKTNG